METDGQWHISDNGRVTLKKGTPLSVVLEMDKHKICKMRGDDFDEFFAVPAREWNQLFHTPSVKAVGPRVVEEQNKEPTSRVGFDLLDEHWNAVSQTYKQLRAAMPQRALAWLLGEFITLFTREECEAMSKRLNTSREEEEED